MQGTTTAGPDSLGAARERYVNKQEYDDYIAGQVALGRDVSEYKPEIREQWAALHQAQERGFFDKALSRNDGQDLFGQRFEGQKLPLWRRWFWKLLGYDL